jgi:hypothetical protein
MRCALGDRGLFRAPAKHPARDGAPAGGTGQTYDVLMRQAASAVVVSLFAVVFLHAAWAIRFLNPVFSRYLGVGLPGGPNVLLTVRGRSSGRWRRTPVAMLQFGDRRFVQAPFGEVTWVRSLRASGQAVVTKAASRSTPSSTWSMGDAGCEPGQPKGRNGRALGEVARRR